MGLIIFSRETTATKSILCSFRVGSLTVLHSERPKLCAILALHTILAFLSAIGLRNKFAPRGANVFPLRVIPIEEGCKTENDRVANPLKDYPYVP